MGGRGDTMTTRAHLSIGEVLSLLQDEFPDITISKIRFLESEGLIDPERTTSGYRKFYEKDVDRLRAVGLFDEDILDVTLAAAARCFFSTVLEALGVQPDPAFKALDPDLRAALTVGRPIAEA